ncbi:MAG TPA: shikimate kinase, partial [Gemmatimonadales bacterium]|nr:shikimate kinase [Gemmatimonadales bacterium]
MRRSLVLIGLPGAGKTVVGRRLAERLDVPFHDLDELIEQRSGRTITR